LSTQLAISASIHATARGPSRRGPGKVLSCTMRQTVDRPRPTRRTTSAIRSIRAGWRHLCPTMGSRTQASNEFSHFGAAREREQRHRLAVRSSSPSQLRFFQVRPRWLARCLGIDHVSATPILHHRARAIGLKCVFVPPEAVRALLLKIGKASARLPRGDARAPTNGQRTDAHAIVD
jgi:hypothetical protein